MYVLIEVSLIPKLIKKSCLEVQLWYISKDDTQFRPLLEFAPTSLIRLNFHGLLVINEAPLYLYDTICLHALRAYEGTLFKRFGTVVQQVNLQDVYGR